MPYVMVSNKKCTGCHMCELACSAWHEGVYRPSLSRLTIAVNPTTAVIKSRTCLQTACGKCAEACPEGAIEQVEIEVRPAGGEPVKGFVLKVNEAKCTDCGACYDACPTGVIKRHPDRGVAYKCDLCDGDPQCIAFCQNPHVLAVSLRVSKADQGLAE
jgi:Fe-S-cluster-containing hydrogenase component 2